MRGVNKSKQQISRLRWSLAFISGALVGIGGIGLWMRSREQQSQTGTAPETRLTLSRLLWKLALDSGGGKARGFLAVWPLVEAIQEFIAQKLTPQSRRNPPKQQIPGAPTNIILMQPEPYPGSRSMTLPDGTTVVTGDLVIELHTNSPVSSRVLDEEQVWGVMRSFRGDLEALARWLQDHEEYKAIWGFSLLHAFASRAGFTLRDRPRTFYEHLLRLWLDGLLVIYSQAGVARLQQGNRGDGFPKELWMSRQEMLRRYGAMSERSKVTQQP